MDELVAPALEGLPRQTVVGDFILDRQTIRVLRKHKPLQLSMRQFQLLDIFMRHPDEPMSFQELRDAVWGASSTIEDGTVAAAIARLRHVVGFHYGKNPIKSVRGVGFLFEAEPSRIKPRKPRNSIGSLKTDALGSGRQDQGDDPTKYQHHG
jgi:two-component system phosphate regulon response regulator PhoB